MAFPPKIYEEDYVMGYVAREVIKDEPYEGMMQNSGHHRNFVFSDAADLPGGEHEPRLPVLKVSGVSLRTYLWWVGGRTAIARPREEKTVDETRQKKNLWSISDLIRNTCSSSILAGEK